MRFLPAQTFGGGTSEYSPRHGQEEFDIPSYEETGFCFPVPKSPRAAFLRLRVGLGDFAAFCEMVWNRIPKLLRVAISLIYEAAILKLISIFLGL